MYCTKCGAKVSDDSVFCTSCGCKLQVAEETPIKMVRLKCQDCGGELDIDASKQITLCPYCHSKQIIVESDEVKIATIESEERKIVNLEKIKSNESIRIYALGLLFFVFMGVLCLIVELLC